MTQVVVQDLECLKLHCSIERLRSEIDSCRFVEPKNTLLLFNFPQSNQRRGVLV